MSAAYLIRGVLGRFAIDTIDVATASEAVVAVHHFRANPRLVVTVQDRTGAIVDDQALLRRACSEDVPPSSPHRRRLLR